jgi:hypothetical protein
MPKPFQLILDLQSELRVFSGVTRDPETPTVDLEATLSRIIDVVAAQRFDYLVEQIASDTSTGEGLIECSDLEDSGKSRVFYAVKQLSEEIRNKLLELHAYDRGTFPYTYKSLLNHDTILLTYSPPAFR